jgi:hypothetical protein
MANQTITQLPDAGPITGTELVPIVQNGGTFKTTAAALAGSPVQTQTFLTVNLEPTLNNSRFLSTGTGLGLVDGGAQSFYRITLNGVSGTLESMGGGFGVKVGGTMTPRSITFSGAGLNITNGDGQSGDPVVSLTGTVASLAGSSGTGFLALPGNNTVSGRTLTGTANQIGVTNPNGIAGDPVFSIVDNPVLPGTGGATVPNGTTAERPALPNAGTVRYNSTTGRIEGYATVWQTFGSGDGTVTSISGVTDEITVANPTTTPIIGLADNPILPGNASVKVPAGTTSERPPSPINGQFRYNAQIGFFEGYANGAWDQFTTGGTGVTSIDVSGGATGLTTTGGPVTSIGTITLAGTLITPNGGTGLNTYAAGDTLFYTSGDALSKLTIGTAGYINTSSGTAPQWSNPTGLTVGTATNLAGGAAGSLPYQSAAGTTAFLATGTGLLANDGTNPSYTLTPSGLTSVTVTQDPVSALQLATKQYVDTLIASGIHFHAPVRVESPINLNATYNNGTAGVGATLTNAGTQAALVIDGVTVSVNDRVLVYEQTTQTQNGIYVVTDVGSGATNWILTRASDADTYVINSAAGLSEGSTVFVQQGATGAGETYTCNTSGVITFGTTNITFVQTSTAQIYSAGTGLTLTGTQFSLTSPVATSLGGTGVTSTPTNGQLLIGNGSGFGLSTLTAGTGIGIVNSSGSITINSSGATVDDVIALAIALG